jgi:hypothetical protein
MDILDLSKFLCKKPELCPVFDNKAAQMIYLINVELINSDESNADVTEGIRQGLRYTMEFE